MLDINELSDLEEALKVELFDKLEEVLIRLNRTGELEEFLRLINMQELLGLACETAAAKDGIIIVIGQSEVEKEKLAAVAKDMGFDKNKMEFYLDYKAAKTFDFKKTQWSDKYSCILVGQMPHSGSIKGDYSSMISALECEKGYPQTVRVGTNGLKITKSSFRETLKFLLNENIVELS